ncbi:MAG: glycosyltransferase family 2 protein [Vicinamibacterales bacterium]
MRHQPTVSIVIPAYMQAEFLRDAIDSALAQDHPAVEVIVVDDASPDETAAIVKQYGSKIRYVRHDENRGLAASRNSGFRESSGELVAFLDSDDYFHPEKMTAHAAFMEQHPEVGVSYNARFDLDYSRPTIRQVWSVPPVCHLQDFVVGFPFAPSDMVVRRSWLEAGFLFDESLVFFSEDLEITCRMALAGCRFGGINRALNYRRYHTNRHLQVEPRHAAACAVLERVFADVRCPASVTALRSRALAFHALGWAIQAFVQRETSLGVELLRRALTLEPILLEGDPTPLIQELVEFCIADDQVDHEASLTDIINQIPPDIRILRQELDWAVAQGFLRRGARAALWQRPDDAKRHFEVAEQRCANADDKFINDMVYALLALGRECGVSRADAALTELMRHLRTLSDAGAARRLRGCYAMNAALQCERDGRPGVLEHVWDAIANQPAYLMNRGLLAVSIRSLMSVRPSTVRHA